MIRFLAWFFGGIVVLALIGQMVGGGENTATTVTTTTTYLATSPEVEAAIMELAEGICDALDSGLTITDVANVFMAEGKDGVYFTASMVGAVELVCPEYRDALNTWGRTP